MLEKKRILQLRERRWTQGHRRVHGEAAEAAKKKYDRWGIDGDLAVCSAIVKGRIQPISRWNRFCDKFMTASKGKGIFSRAEIEAALLHPAQRHYHALRRHGAISAEVLRLAKQASEEELLKEGLREIV